VTICRKCAKALPFENSFFCVNAPSRPPKISRRTYQPKKKTCKENNLQNNLRWLIKLFVLKKNRHSPSGISPSRCQPSAIPATRELCKALPGNGDAKPSSSHCARWKNTRQKFSQVLHIVSLYSNYDRALTFANIHQFCPRPHARSCARTSSQQGCARARMRLVRGAAACFSNV